MLQTKKKKKEEEVEEDFYIPEEANNAWFCSESASVCAVDAVCYCVMQIESRCTKKQFPCKAVRQTNSHTMSEMIPVMCWVIAVIIWNSNNEIHSIS